jgi:hypothetical protein
MRIDRTFTIRLEEQELDRLITEIEYMKLPPDLGWRPVLGQIVASRQITLPLRAVERLVLELDIVRTNCSNKNAKDFQKRFPMLYLLTEEINGIFYRSNCRSA